MWVISIERSQVPTFHVSSRPPLSFLSLVAKRSSPIYAASNKKQGGRLAKDLKVISSLHFLIHGQPCSQALLQLSSQPQREAQEVGMKSMSASWAHFWSSGKQSSSRMEGSKKAVSVIDREIQTDGVVSPPQPCFQPFPSAMKCFLLGS